MEIIGPKPICLKAVSYTHLLAERRAGNQHLRGKAMENKIYSINGPVVTIKGKTDLEMMEMVYVGTVSYTHLALSSAAF